MDVKAGDQDKWLNTCTNMRRNVRWVHGHAVHVGSARVDFLTLFGTRLPRIVIVCVRR